MPRWKIGLIILASVIIVVAPIVFVCLFGPQTMMALTAQWEYRKVPVLAKTPVALPDQSVSATPHHKISYFGYELELPWDDVDEQKGRTFSAVHVTYFLSGNAFWFSTFPPKSFVNEIMKTGKFDPETFQQIYGADASQSDYGFHSAMLRTTPDSINPFMSRRDAARDSTLLVIKAIATPACQSGIFEIQVSDLRGFQYEGPQGRPVRIIDDLYGKDGGVEVWFLQKAGGSAPSITQAEINRVLQSIHKVSAATPAPAAQPRH
jgi:hypothetical protein